MNSIATVHPELIPEWSEKNYPLTPYNVTFGSNKLAWWKGNCGHEWNAVIKSRANGASCPYCAHVKVLKGFNDLESNFPKLASEWSERNYPLKPDMVTPYSNKKVWWKCNTCGNEWETLIPTRSYGSKCPYCSGQILKVGLNDLKTKHHNIAEEWSERNLTLRPEMVNEKSCKNVWWKCNTCGYEYKAVIKSRVKGLICPVCSERKIQAGYNDLATTDKALINEWNYQRNADVLPIEVSRYARRFVWWKCSCGHEWRERICERIINHSICKECESEFLLSLPKLLIDLYSRRQSMKVLFDCEDIIGINTLAYIPEIKLELIDNFPDHPYKVQDT